MHAIQKQFHDFVNDKHLIEDGEHMLLAVSGGVDSMVMAHLFLTGGFNFSIAHCNYGLRGEDSDGDEAFVKEWAETNKVRIHSRQFKIQSGSIQLEARNLRYEWFKELQTQFGYQKIATAHHLNDSLETLIINLTRGTGIKGVSGISAEANGIIRPLLFMNREQILDYAKETGLKWREDASNQKTDYDRNFIRHEIVPRLQEMNPSLLHTFYHTSERLHLSHEIVAEKVAAIKRGFMEHVGDKDLLSLTWIKKRSDLMILSEILSAYGFNYVTVREVFEARTKPGKTFFSNGWQLSMDRDACYLSPLDKDEIVSVTINEPGLYRLGETGLEVNMSAKGAVIHDPYVAQLDAAKLTFPLIVRPWKKGDKFRPLGMRGMKKISDFLIDQKVPLALKEHVLVVASAGEIAWVVGYRIADDFKVTSATKETVVLRYK